MDNAAQASTGNNRSISAEERQQLIAEMAYHLAEEREFKGDCQLHDWLEAEARITHMYGPGEFIT